MKLYRPADLEKDTDTLLMCVVPYELPTEVKIAEHILGHAIFEERDGGMEIKDIDVMGAAKAITNLLKGER